MHESLHTLYDVVRRPLTAGVSGAAFWTAVLLPLGYLPVLAGQVETFPVLPILLAIHAVCLLLGHRWGGSPTLPREGAV